MKNLKDKIGNAPIRKKDSRNNQNPPIQFIIHEDREAYCNNCGTMATKLGSMYKCYNCGSSQGLS